MANKIKKEKARAIAAEYIIQNFDKRKTLLNIGYSKSYIETSRGMAIFNNVLVKSELARLQAKIELKTGYTIEYIQKEHRRLADLAEEKGDLGVATRNIELIGKTRPVGAYVDAKEIKHSGAVTLSELIKAADKVSENKDLEGNE